MWMEVDFSSTALSAFVHLCNFVFLLYAFPIWPNLITSLRFLFLKGTAASVCKDEPQSGSIQDGEEPHVTVQVCAYNEGSVISKTLDSICEIDWPRDKLCVQICDDSTDEMSIAIIQKEVKFWEDRGRNVQHLRRPDRVGYKAGNLRHNFQYIEGDFVLYFDADHRPQPGILRNCMPYFFDKQGVEKAKTLLVQTAWSFHNPRDNLITECDSFCIDAFYLFEYARAIRNKFFPFWGTGGLWRKQAIEDAGGFTWESITEDVLLSYKALMAAGDCECVYLPQFPQCLEIPNCILAQIQQKSRWGKGFAQVFRKHGWTVVASPQVSIAIKIEFLFHILRILRMVALVFPVLVLPHLQGPESTWLGFAKILSYLVEFVVGDVLAILNKPTTQAGNSPYQSIWSRLTRLRFVVPSFAFRIGLAGFELKSAFGGWWLSTDTTFLTTPKSGSINKAVKKSEDDAVAAGTLLLGLLHGVAVLVNDPFANINSDLVRYFSIYIDVCFLLGTVCVPLVFFRAKYEDQWDSYMSLPGSLEYSRKLRKFVGLNMPSPE